MIRKHIDLVAIALLLGGAALYTHVRQLALVDFQSYENIALAQTIRRAVACNRATPAKPCIKIHKAIVIPNAPVTARISVSTD